MKWKQAAGGKPKDSFKRAGLNLWLSKGVLSTRMFRLIIVLLGIVFCSWFSLGAQPQQLQNARRVLFLGDSITHGGLYIDYLEGYLLTRYPEKHWEIINLGLPSETVSGLSEPGHAGGQFPRPDLHERLDRALEKVQPDLVFACYGMNDGIYYPLDDARLRSYQEGTRKLRAKVQAAHARIIHITPPTFDPEPIKSKTLPAGLEVYPSPYVGYNDVLGKFSDWLVEQRAGDWTVIDLHRPMDRYLAQRRKTDPRFHLAGDGVHPNGVGHWIFAREILLALRVPSEVDTTVVDGSESVTRSSNEGFRFEWKTRIPMPMDPSWDPNVSEEVRRLFNVHQVKVIHLSKAKYRLKEGDTEVGTFTKEELATGLDLLNFSALTTNQKAKELFKLVHRRQRILTDAWLTEVGHKRPGMAKGLPMDAAQTKASEIEKQMRALAQPVTLSLSLVPE
ncbi:MAG: lysophospholipase L1-like esterase [Verrucomicrobiales bacterium]|nr:lysophospholipase L1-like esterase [Verrucomicrobiales bacterium]